MGIQVGDKYYVCITYRYGLIAELMTVAVGREAWFKVYMDNIKKVKKCQK